VKPATAALARGFPFDIAASAFAAFEKQLAARQASSSHRRRIAAWDGVASPVPAAVAPALRRPRGELRAASWSRAA